ncbi:TPA: helix-turn-helix domain-containing protein [Clostridioides difficile]|nr:helix-turn-helix domain-containing protein [Clostridioides difficile]
MGIGENIKTFRKDRRMTQEQLAEKAGISRVALGNYEREERVPNLDILEKLATALDTSTDIIMNLHKFSLDEIHELNITDGNDIPLTEEKYAYIKEKIDFYTSEIIEAPHHALESYYQRAFMYAILGDYENAIADYTKVIETNSKYKNALLERGNLYTFLGYPEKALSDLDKILDYPNRKNCRDILEVTIPLKDLNKILKIRNKNNKEQTPYHFKKIRFIDDNAILPFDEFDYLIKKEHLNNKKDKPSLSSKIDLLNDDCLDLISNLVDKLIKDKNNLK